MNLAHMRLTKEDIAHVVLLLFHANAQFYPMLSTLWIDGTMVLQPKFTHHGSGPSQSITTVPGSR